MISNWKSGKPKITEQDKFIAQKWIDFNNLPKPLFLPWNNLLKSEFIETIKRAATSS